MNIIDLAAVLNRGHYGYEEALNELTSIESKTAFAVEKVKLEQSVFAVPDAEIQNLAAQFAHPDTRKEALKALGSFGYQPGIQWAGTSISIQMGNVFADEDKDGATFVVTVPEYWSCDLWGSDRDLGEDGYEYSHWISSTLPSIGADTRGQTPTKYVLLSNMLSGTLYWGGNVIDLYRGEVSVELEHNELAGLINA
jgi:hypothetical protein